MARDVLALAELALVVLALVLAALVVDFDVEAFVVEAFFAEDLAAVDAFDADLEPAFAAGLAVARFGVVGSSVALGAAVSVDVSRVVRASAARALPAAV